MKRAAGNSLHVPAIALLGACSLIVPLKEMPAPPDAGGESSSGGTESDEARWDGPACGNGRPDDGEECDDGKNGDPDDGCR